MATAAPITGQYRNHQASSGPRQPRQWTIPYTPGVMVATAAQAVGNTVNTKPRQPKHWAIPKTPSLTMTTAAQAVGKAVSTRLYHGHGSSSHGQDRKHQGSSWPRQPKQWAIPETPGLIMATAAQAVGNTVNTRPHYGHGSPGRGQYHKHQAASWPRQPK